MTDLVQTLVFVFVYLLYLVMGVFAYRFLAPRLLPMARWLATIFLAAQIAVIVMSQVTLGDSGVMGWLWHLDKEWNAQAILASLQLALAGAAAFLTAWLAKERDVWLRLYFLMVGCLFIFMSYDEIAALHECCVALWPLLYGAAGLGLLAATAVVARRDQPKNRLWHACLPIGLGLAFLGASALEGYAIDCGAWGVTRLFGECVDVVVVEESLEFMGVWLALTALLGQLSAAGKGPPRLASGALCLAPALWIASLLPLNIVKPLSQQIEHRIAKVEFAEGAQLHAYHIEEYRKNAGLRIHLWLSRAGWSLENLGYSIQVIDQANSALVAKLDTFANHHGDLALAPSYRMAFRQWDELRLPPEAAANRAYWLALTLWRQVEGSYVRHEIIASDLPALSNTQVILDEFVIRSSNLPASEPALAAFDSGFVLQSADMPSTVRRGDTREISFSWRSAQSSQADYTQFLHFQHEASGAFWNFDQQPLGARLPTRLWYSGLADLETWHVPVPADLEPGRYAVYTGLYDLESLERLPGRDADGNDLADSRLSLGTVLVMA